VARFLVDESLPRSVTTALVAAGHDAVDARDSGLRGASDAMVYARAVTEDRIVVSGDTDFANALRFPPGSHPGIIVLRVPNSWTPSERARRLANALDDALLVAVPKWLVVDRRLLMAELLPFISLQQSFIAELGAFIAELLPFVALPRSFIAELSAFVGHVAPRELHLLPFVGQEHLSLDVLALRIADCLVLMGDEQMRVREARGFIEHRCHDVAHEDVKIADESPSRRNDHDKLADRATSLGHADAKLAVVHSRLAHESVKLALNRARQADPCAELPSPRTRVSDRMSA
jgi:predicted nuclease of predicted toxin-antitoxin system